MARRRASDSGRDVIPAMLAAGAPVYGHRFDSYWHHEATAPPSTPHEG